MFSCGCRVAGKDLKYVITIEKSWLYKAMTSKERLQWAIDTQNSNYNLFTVYQNIEYTTHSYSDCVLRIYCSQLVLMYSE